MNTSNPDIVHLVDHLSKLGLKHVVISPGSRNAPLIKAFNQSPEIKCYSVIDERAAGFFALGLAQQLKSPVAAICTSGSALLNYSPAVAEAFYQRIPLLIISADRPQEWINQGDGQAINQRAVFSNYSKGYFEFKESRNHVDSAWHNVRLTSDAYNLCNLEPQGPVHLNVPLSEPLYLLSDQKIQAIKTEYQTVPGTSSLTDNQLTALANQVNECQKVMLIIGQHAPDEELAAIASNFAAFNNFTVLTETTSNILGDNLIDQIDNCLAQITVENQVSFAPQLLITCGGMVVTKRLKQFLRTSNFSNHWHIDLAETPSDTYQKLSTHLKVNSLPFLSSLYKKCNVIESEFRTNWLKIKETSQYLNQRFIQSAPYSDLVVFDFLAKNIPESSMMQLGNSTVIRYNQLFPNKQGISYFGNRGVSGIDGCTSTAVGASVMNPEPTIFISGDISFLYDANGLWNNYTPSNFLAIVINNSGGNIFRIIDGPNQFEETPEFIETTHNLSVKPLAELHGFRYLSASSLTEVKSIFPEAICFREKTILEIFTSAELSANTLKHYWEYLKTGE